MSVSIAKEYCVNSLSLFGSYARGEANEDSDIDFFFDKGEVKSLLQYSSLINKLEEAFDCSVDLVSTGINNKEFLEKIREGSVLLYEK
ncbi:nucleotidyltransferase domain-containing protein (plasmid) [Methanosphaera sp. ISO3-F5]|uniref:nucleotidyltransferase family protein n=1 Tax=Methanosphaera sp. ISO3-F5 TaxID=1452353 RepID=UPI002B260C8D|nr:nucleotidyltransferase domain-containing protein [Methanosphaera sp. ISO3-F5]